MNHLPSGRRRAGGRADRRRGQAAVVGGDPHSWPLHLANRGRLRAGVGYRHRADPHCGRRSADACRDPRPARASAASRGRESADSLWRLGQAGQCRRVNGGAACQWRIGRRREFESGRFYGDCRGVQVNNRLARTPGELLACRRVHTRRGYPQLTTDGARRSRRRAPHSRPAAPSQAAPGRSACGRRGLYARLPCCRRDGREKRSPAAR